MTVSQLTVISDKGRSEMVMYPYAYMHNHTLAVSSTKLSNLPLSCGCRSCHPDTTSLGLSPSTGSRVIVPRKRSIFDTSPTSR